jgi:hypothetical protein
VLHSAPRPLLIFFITRAHARLQLLAQLRPCRQNLGRRAPMAHAILFQRKSWQVDEVGTWGSRRHGSTSGTPHLIGGRACCAPSCRSLAGGRAGSTRKNTINQLATTACTKEANEVPCTCSPTRRTNLTGGQCPNSTCLAGAWGIALNYNLGVTFDCLCL